MHREPAVSFRQHFTERLDCDLVIARGGMAGTCAAVTAARQGIRVVLIQDRPVLGGNASSEVRVWVLGATSHMGNNNRWAREGGVIDEILVENIFRNPQGNPIIFDMILLEKVKNEPNINLLLNTTVIEVGKSNPDRIDFIRAFCSQNSTLYEVFAPLFCDATGDGLIGFLSGAAFRMGAESKSEFDEKLAPTKEYGELLGHSLYFYSKDVGFPVEFVPPSFALQNVQQIPRLQGFNLQQQGIRLWWIEYGGRLDTVYDTEVIKWELWKIVYGVWNYIKNSGEYPEAENLTLEWVGLIPGKRESRRFEGDYILNQQDLVEQRLHNDAVSHGGWALDLHPADGIYSEKPGCSQWHMRGIFQIPYRCMYSKNISNLFLAGRVISVSHVAFGSTRVQGTLAQGAQAVGMAAAICSQQGLLPRQLSTSPSMKTLQQKLLRAGQFIPKIRHNEDTDLALQARITASSHLVLNELSPSDDWLLLDDSWAQILPVTVGRMPIISINTSVKEDTIIHVEIRTGNSPDNYTPDVILASKEIHLSTGHNQPVSLDFDIQIDQPRYIFVCFLKNEAVALQTSRDRLTGILSAANKFYPDVSNFGKQEPAYDIGIESFEFWCPQRRPSGHNLAMKIDPGLNLFAPDNVINGWHRPTDGPNAWLASRTDPAPVLTLTWDEPIVISRLDLYFDTDFDHPMESVLMGHPERAMPFCIKHYQIITDEGTIVFEEINNYTTQNTIRFNPPIKPRQLHIHVLECQGNAPIAIFGISCFDSE
jgi:hypothetical protein